MKDVHVSDIIDVYEQKLAAFAVRTFIFKTTEHTEASVLLPEN